MSIDAIRYRVHIQHNATGAVDILEGEFTAPESEQLRAFIREVRTVENTRFVSGGMCHAWSLQSDGSGGLVSPVLPPEADMAEFLYRLRPIILDDEPTSFAKASSLLGAQFEHPYFRRKLKRLGQHFRAISAQRYFRIYSNDVLINCEATLKLWLNGFEYHRDRDKAQLISDVSSGLPFEIQKAIYLDLLSLKTNAAVSLGNWIEEIGRTASER